MTPIIARFQKLLLSVVLPVVLGTTSLLSQTITTTKDDGVVPGVRKLRGGTITYTNTINNTGGANATSVTYTESTPANVTDTGAVKVTPIAVDDSYVAVGNTVRTVSAGAGILANDFDPDGGAFTVKVGSGARVSGTATGGVLSVNLDGSFSYTPGAGQIGTERFQYTITDADGLDSVTVGFVDFTMTARVWYVQNASSNGDGRSHAPFNSITSANTAANASTDIIYVFSDTGNPKLSGNFVLENSQQLLGQGVALTVSSLNLFSAATAPQILNASGDIVTLAQNNTVSGLELNNRASTGYAIKGSSFGTLTASTISISGTGQALGLNSGTVSASFDSLVASGGTIGVGLTNVSGTLDISSGALSGFAGADFLVNGGSASINMAGTITDLSGSSGGGRAVDIQNKGGGTVTFSGNITNNISGIFLNSNSGATINFTGRIGLNAGANSAFTATGGGTVSASNTGNVITTTTGTAVNVANTTIGASDVIFKSVNVNGAANGIVLNATGSSGGFIILGSGTADSGGTIQNTTSSAISATDTMDLSLTRIKISNPGNHGISASNLRGTCLLDSSTITGLTFSTANGIDLVNSSGTLTEMRVKASTFSSFTTANRGINYEAQATANMAVIVESGCTFTGMFGDAVGFQSITGSSGTLSLIVRNSTFNNAAASGNGGIGIAPFGGPINFTFSIHTNSFDSVMIPLSNAGAINVTDGDLDGSGPVVNGSIRGNTINNLAGGRGISVTSDTFAGLLTLLIDGNTVDRLGSTSKHGISVNVNNSAFADVTVSNNDIGLAANLWTAGNGLANGILLQTQNSGAMDALLSNNRVTANTSFEVMRVRVGHTSTLNATVTGNTLSDTVGTHIEFEAATGTGATVGGTLCVNVSGNTVPAAGVGIIRLSENTSGTLNVVQSSTANVSSLNNSATVTPTGTPQFSQPACTLP